MDAKRSDRLIFLHIPKTAGVNVRELLARQYPGPQTFIRGAPEHQTLFHMSRGERETYRVVGGHFRFGLHILFDSPSRYLTLLRDPIERVISHYSYIRWQAGHPWHRRVVESGVSLEQWVRLGIGGGEDNLQIRYLTDYSGKVVAFRETTRQMLEEAKRVLSERIDFLGVTECYEESVRLFTRQLGWHEPLQIERLNASPNRVSAADLPLGTRAAIVEHNELDIELYEFALSLFKRRLTASISSAVEA